MTNLTNHRVSGERLWGSLMEMAEIGATDKGGSRRLTMTDLDIEGRKLFESWCQTAGYEMSTDQIGNIFVKRAGKQNDLPPVVMGSHLDTQPTGGKFDGVFGVLAGLEVLRTLDDNDIETNRPVEVVVWTNEEGSRYPPAMMGSGVFAGKFELEDMRTLEDVDGISLGSELDRHGYSESAKVGGREFASYFEAHIEQGPILEGRGKTIGVVTGGQGIRWYDINITGQEAHAGPTPMEVRHDALGPAACIISELHQFHKTIHPMARATVGEMRVMPSSRNVIPGQVFMSVDLRHEQAEVLEEMHNRLGELVEELRGQFQGTEITLSDFWHSPPTPFTPELVDMVRQSAEHLGLDHMDIVSGAGHDALYVASIAPAAMIFIPCRDGISHNEIEHAEPEHITAGADVLLQSVLVAAGRTT